MIYTVHLSTAIHKVFKHAEYLFEDSDIVRDPRKSGLFGVSCEEHHAPRAVVDRTTVRRTRPGKVSFNFEVCFNIEVCLIQTYRLTDFPFQFLKSAHDVFNVVDVQTTLYLLNVVLTF